MYSMARHPYGESTKRRALFILEKLQMQGKLAESGLLLDTRISGDARQEIYLLVVNVVGADGSGDEVLAALRSHFAEKLHTHLNSDIQRIFVTFRRGKGGKLDADIEVFRITPVLS